MSEKAIKVERQCLDCYGTFMGSMDALHCPKCCWKYRKFSNFKRKYEWTVERDQVLRDRYDSKVRGRASEIARILGWPTWAIKKRAAILGLAHPFKHQDWTQKEVDFLLDHLGARSAHWLSQKLHRSIASVVMKAKHMRISRRVRLGYTLRELGLCFGVDHHSIERWVREGKLQIRKRHTKRKNEIWLVSDKQVLEFVSSYPLAFRLDKVDQTWFMDLITGGGLLRKALKTAVREEAEDPDEEVA